MFANLDGLFSIPFLLFFAWLGWILWEGIFFLIGLLPVALTWG